MSMKKTQFSSLLISDLKQFCCCVVSHPLYLSYFVFFSPYLLKILSFIFPLVFTTSLLLLAFLADSKVGDLLSACHAVVDTLTSNIEDGTQQECFDLEDFEAYKIVFEAPIMFVQENQSSVENSVGANVKDEKKVEAQGNNNGSEESNVNKTKTAIAENCPALKVESSTQSEESSLCIMDSCLASVDQLNQHDLPFHNPVRSGRGRFHFLGNESSRTLDYNLGSSGSMRKEKEWKRTLACKLYEERNSTDGSGEGMDLLWETYEMDAIKSKTKTKTKHDEWKKKNMKRRGESKRYNNEDSDDEAGEVSDQLCCLQALKFSAGKVNLGMGKPNLLKISKAIKGFGWLHHVTKHSKKLHIEDRF